MRSRVLVVPALLIVARVLRYRLPLNVLRTAVESPTCTLPPRPVRAIRANPAVTTTLRPRRRIVARMVILPVQGPKVGQRSPTPAWPLRTFADCDPSTTGPATATLRVAAADRF